MLGVISCVTPWLDAPSGSPLVTFNENCLIRCPRAYVDPVGDRGEAPYTCRPPTTFTLLVKDKDMPLVCEELIFHISYFNKNINQLLPYWRYVNYVICRLVRLLNDYPTEDNVTAKKYRLMKISKHYYHTDVALIITNFD